MIYRWRASAYALAGLLEFSRRAVLETAWGDARRALRLQWDLLCPLVAARRRPATADRNSYRGLL